jgi:hypothetical protein
MAPVERCLASARGLPRRPAEPDYGGQDGATGSKAVNLRDDSVQRTPFSSAAWRQLAHPFHQEPGLGPGLHFCFHNSLPKGFRRK